METPTREQLKQRIAALMGRTVFSMMGPAVSESLPIMELTMPQLRVLFLIHARGPLRMSDMASYLGVGMPTVSSLVSKLEEKGVLAREHDTQDRRIVRCLITPEGQRQVEQFSRIRQERMDRIISALTGEELVLVMKAMETVIRAVRQVSDSESSSTREPRN